MIRKRLHHVIPSGARNLTLEVYARIVSRMFNDSVRGPSSSLGMTARGYDRDLRTCGRSLGKARPHFRENDKGDSDHDQEEGKELAAREYSDQGRVRLAKVFDNDAKDSVANEKQSGQNAVGLTRARPDEPQDREQDNSFEESFVELRRMTRC